MAVFEFPVNLGAGRCKDSLAKEVDLVVVAFRGGSLTRKAKPFSSGTRDASVKCIHAR